MKKIFQSNLITTGLAIFSMLFGAANIMLPIQVGMLSGDQNVIGMFGFIITAILLPVAGFIGMILYNGNYNSFFNRLGTSIGASMVLICMIIIGPFIAIPRITTLSHVMIAPFLPGFLATIDPLSSFIFALIFLGITFSLAYKENRIVDILGFVISPLLLIALAIIIIKGIVMGGAVIQNTTPPLDIFASNLRRGYETLDLLGALFFSSIVLTILKNKMGKTVQYNPNQLAIVGLKASLIGVTLLAFVYVGMSLLGVYHGHGLEQLNAGEIFREVSFRILGAQGALVIATAVLMACLSTSTALGAVVAEYVQNEIFKRRISFTTALILVLASCLPLSVAGLGYILAQTGGVITYVGYPVLITLTFCNIAHKLLGINTVKIPVLLTFVITCASYYNWF